MPAGRRSVPARSQRAGGETSRGRLAFAIFMPSLSTTTCIGSRSSRAPTPGGRLPGAKIGRFAPAFYHDAAAFRVDCDDQARRRPAAARNPPRKSAVYNLTGRMPPSPPITAVAHPDRAIPAPFHAADAPPPTRVFAFDGQKAHQISVRSAPDRGVEIDHLNLGKRGELAQHFLGRIACQRLLATLPPTGPLCRP